MNIQRISEDSSERICAGQVIPNLHSSVRELIENALDANAQSISVRIRDNAAEIEVTDDGSGICEDDWNLLCVPHATSKIRDDIPTLPGSSSTHGFRGQALAALCVLSREVRVSTRTGDLECGTVISFQKDGCLLGSGEKVSRSRGSTVTVTGLYRDSLPVRHLEMVRTLKKEIKTVQHLITEFAIFHFSKHFEFLVDGKCLVNSSGGSSSYDVYKRLVVGGDLEGLECTNLGKGIQVFGWITPAYPSTVFGEMLKGSGDQFRAMYLNGKPMTVSKNVVKCLSSIYGQFNIQKLSFILMIQIENKLSFDRNASVDKRNVLLTHDIDEALQKILADEVTRMFDRKPVKAKETKLEFRSSVLNCEISAKKALGESNIHPIRDIRKNSTYQSETEPVLKRVKVVAECSPDIFSATVPKESDASLENVVEEIENIVEEQAMPQTIPFVFSKSLFLDMGIIGQFNNGFIITRLAGSRTDFFLIDQHAANEKFLFEQYHRNIKLNIQTLISPISLKLNPTLEASVQEHCELLRANGFVLDFNASETPGSRIRLLSLPTLSGVGFNRSASLTVADLIELIELIAGDLIELSGLQGAPHLLPRLRSVRAMFASKACRTAVMVGDSLTHSKMVEIVHSLSALDQPWNCPHGRPTLKHILSLDDLRKLQ